MKQMTVAAMFSAVCLLAPAAGAVELHGGAEVRTESAYIFNGMIYNDEPVINYMPFLQLNLTEDFWIGGFIWQLHDLTPRRRDNEPGSQCEWAETSYSAGLGGTLLKGDDWKLTAALSWYWDTEFRHRHYRMLVNYPRLNLEFENPWLTPFIEWDYDFRNMHSMFFQPGVKHDFDLTETVWLEAKAVAYGGHYRAVRTTFLSESAKTGLAALEGRLTLNWDVAEFCTIGCYCAVNGIVASRIKDDWDSYGEYLPEFYNHDVIVYGGVVARVGF